jgi:hypothetical protein
MIVYEKQKNTMSIGFDYYPSFPEDMKRQAFLNLQTFIEGRINANKPFWIARMSGIEYGEIGRYYKKQDFSSVLVKDIQQHSGIHITNEESFLKYIRYTQVALANCDRLAIWDGGCYQQCQDMYNVLKTTLAKYIYTFPAHVLEPYYFMGEEMYRFPELFRDKKILIVTSHADSVRYQVENHLPLIFEPYSIFPQKENIQVYKTAQQNGESCDGEEWSVHFDTMCKEIESYDFDVAFIGCGGFSNLLGYHIRSKMNKSAIYVGGPLQIYFGIIGRRWLYNHTIMEKVRTHQRYWIQPLTSDYVQGCEKVDQACYWM